MVNNGFKEFFMKFLLSVIIGMCFFTLLISPVFAGEQLWEFDSDSDDWKVANGNWSVTDGVYQLTKGGAAEHTLVGESSWSDYTIEAKVRIDDGNWAGIAFRAKSEMEYYVYYFNVPDNKTEFWKHTAGGWTSRTNLAQIPAAGGVEIKNGEWIDMMIEVAGDTFTLYINGEKQSDNQDPSYDSGQVGAWAWQTAVSFDDFRVTSDEIEDSGTPVEPKDKLATTWGRIKGR